MTGWCGKVLQIDVGLHQVEVLAPDISIYRKFVGGKGLAGHYLFTAITRNWDDAEMPLLFFTGPLVGTTSPTSGRMTVMSRSPLTNTVGDVSVGGSLGTMVKKAGWDGIILKGRSKLPMGIEIRDQEIVFADAAAMPGLGTGERHDLLKEKGATVVCGPAAENGVLFSSLVVDGHYLAGRNGLGLLFTAKNIMYLTVRGTGRVAVANGAALKNARAEIFRLTYASPALMGEFGLTKYGTAALFDLLDSRRMMPTANFQRTHFPAARSLNAHAFQEKYRPRKAGCSGCHILCKKITKDGKTLPEFETMSHFSALLNNADIAAVFAANSLCNHLGMDTISAAGTLACYAEIRGRDLAANEIMSLLADIGMGRGIGRELGQGAHRFAQAQGRIETAITVKKQELPAYDPRGAYGMALAYATSTRGGCHLRAYPISHEILRKPVATDRFSFSGKARIVKIAEDMNAVVDSLTACKFLFFAATLEEFAKAFQAVTGEESSAQDLLFIGERIYYQERIMNAQNGFTAADDDLPALFFTQPGSSGADINIPPLDRSDFLRTRAKYYRIRGLDENGRPISEKAYELGLTWKS